MERVVLGLDIGGANLKAATSAGRALSVPFAVWKQPVALSAELRKLIAKFPEASEIAATMTAELCDCYETKREGVRRIVDDMANATKLPIRIWSTDGKFVTPKAAKANHMKVAAANWHALATYCGRLVPKGDALLIDMGTTTTDLIPIRDGKVNTNGMTDPDRIAHHELLYMGWRRTPAMCFLDINLHAAEFFATVHDAHLLLGHVKPDPKDTDTADGRPATKKNAHARLAHMSAGDAETISLEKVKRDARWIWDSQRRWLNLCVRVLQNRLHQEARGYYTLILSGSDIFALERWLTQPRDAFHGDRIDPFSETIKLESHISPAYACAVLEH